MKSLLVSRRTTDANELAAKLWRVWVYARDNQGGREFLSLVLDRPAAAATRAHALALYSDGLLAFRMNDLAASHARNEAAVVEAHAVPDREAEGLALLGLSRSDLSAGDAAHAREHAAASRRLLLPLGAEWGQAPLHMLAQDARLTGALDEAATLFEESLALNRSLGDAWMVVVELHNLGHVELRRGKVDVARRLSRESDAAADPNDPYDGAFTRFNQESVASARGDRVCASTLLEETQSMLASHNIKLASDDQLEFDRLSKQVAPQ